MKLLKLIALPLLILPIAQASHSASPSISTHYSIRLPVSDVRYPSDERIAEIFDYVLKEKSGLARIQPNRCVTFSLGVYGDASEVEGFQKRLPSLVANPVTSTVASNPDDPESPPAGCTKKTCTKSCTDDSDGKKVCTTECEYTCDSRSNGEKIRGVFTAGLVPVKPGQGGCVAPIGFTIAE